MSAAPPKVRSTSGMSIQQKLPLLVSGFLLVVIVLYSWASYEAVRAASLDVARQRLVSLTDQLAQLFDQSTKNEEKALRTLASDTAVDEFVASAGRLSKTAALEALRKSGPRPEITMRAELLDANGAPLLSLHPEPAERHEELSGDLAKAAVGPDFAAVGRLRLINDTLVYPEVAAVVVANKPAGFVVRWRRVQATTQARDQLAGLLGGKASLFIGNDRGDVWTDFVSATPKPPAGTDLTPGKIHEYTRPGGKQVVATTHAVGSVPWVVLVEFSRDAVMAPANAFLRRAAGIGLAVLILASMLVWVVSRSITKPLAELTGAAASLAAGDFSTKVDAGRADELGDLSRAFNAMVARVESAHEGLEEKVRERTEQLRERNEELETFGHSISHDLRAPLRAMHGFSQALIEDCGDQLDDVGKDYAERVVAGARRMDALIQDLLAYSRVSRTDMGLTSVSLHEVAEEALEQVEADVTAAGANVQIAPDLPMVMAHRVALVQAVANLIANGVKFMPAGRVPAIRICAERENGTTRLWVEDNGIGIDPAHHERVFGVFERLHKSENYPGTGIGLAIVRKSVERMGGRVGVESNTGSGSRFWIDLTSVGGTSL
jgi:signal transduction histidine kinase